MGDGTVWTTPSELGEYAFCPRAHHYRHEGGTAFSSRAEAGSAYHRRELAGVRWRDEHRAVPWLALLGGVALIALAAAAVLR